MGLSASCQVDRNRDVILVTDLQKEEEEKKTFVTAEN
jgi:hypothetical protein